MLLILGIIYGVVALLVGLVAFALSDPYGHTTLASRWFQSIVAAVGWPVWLVYGIATLAYYHFWGD